MNDGRVGALFGTREEMMSFFYRLNNPSKNEIIIHNTILDEIEEEISISFHEDTITADVADLDLSFVEPTCKTSLVVGITKEEDYVNGDCKSVMVIANRIDTDDYSLFCYSYEFMAA